MSFLSLFQGQRLQPSLSQGQRLQYSQWKEDEFAKKVNIGETGYNEEKPHPETPAQGEYEVNPMKGKAADKKPFSMVLEPGKKYSWCACGHSKTQVLDSTHTFVLRWGFLYTVNFLNVCKTVFCMMGGKSTSSTKGNNRSPERHYKSMGDILDFSGPIWLKFKLI